MSGTRKRMSNRNFILIMAPILTVLLAVIIVATSLSNVFSYMLDMQFGKGERHVVKATGTEDWDTEYIENKYPDKDTNAAQAKAAALEVNLQLNDEGMILLKNNGVLPFAKGATVTPFGKGYKFPFYDSPNGTASMKHSFAYATTIETALKAASFNIITYAADLQPENTATNKVPGSSQNDGSNYNNYPDQPASAPNTLSSTTASFGASSRIPELGVHRYEELTSPQKLTMAPTTALVFLSRSGSEGADRKIDGYTDGTPHYLALSKNEKDMIKKAKELCTKLVIIINSTNPIELLPIMTGELEADAILWTGNPGENGYLSLGKILCGEVNPSGRLYDIFTTDFFKGPEMANFGQFRYNNINYVQPHQLTSTTRRNYVEYTEGVYMGYRYYETAHDVQEAGFTYGELDGKGGVTKAGAVTYPFGYGMSYTKFDQTITSFSSNGNNITMTVKVTNSGTRAGKEVVQVYYNPPYTQLDKDMKIEKPTANLAAFAKTKLLAAGASENVTITFSKEEMSSYCSTRDNGDGTKGCYMLEAGPYAISLRKDSHYIIDTKTWNNASTIWYDNKNPRQLEKDMQSAMDEKGNLLDIPAKSALDPDAKFIAATNLFPYMTDYMFRETTPLTRANWNATVPKYTLTNGSAGSVGREKAATAETIALFWADRQFNALYTPPTTVNGTINPSSPTGNELLYNPDQVQYGIIEGKVTFVSADKMPKGKVSNDLSILDMRGKDFYDENWQLLLDQLDWEAEQADIQEIVTTSNYYTKELASIGLPRTAHCEGANGIRVGLSEDLQFLTVTWTMCPTTAATWNVELAQKQGEAMAQEALIHGKTSRMSPAFNTHRSPFTGRNLEYYSEDPVLTGKIVTGVLNGSTSGGLIEHIKHFGLNDQETNRSTYLHTWATEQTTREIYNRPFEICIRESRKVIKYTADNQGNTATRVMRGANAMMLGQNMFGPTTAFANYEVCQLLLRDEWGFTGTSITDWFSLSGQWAEGVVLAGTDTLMRGNTVGAGLVMPNYNTATMRTALRTTLHRIAYNIANSNAVQNSPPGSTWYYDISPWKIWLIVANVAAYTIIVAGAVWIVLRLLSERKNPNKYYSEKRDAID